MKILFLGAQSAAFCVPGRAVTFAQAREACTAGQCDLLLCGDVSSAKSARRLKAPKVLLCDATTQPKKAARCRVDAYFCDSEETAQRLLCADADPYRVLTCCDAQELLQLCARVVRRAARPSGRDGVLICGAYGRHNSGDNAILSAIVSQLRTLDPDLPICALSRRPKETARSSGVRSIFLFNIFKSGRYLKKTKLYLSGGGTLLQDATSTRSLLFYLFSLCQAKRAGCRVMLYGCGAGPISHKTNRTLTAKALTRCADRIAVRDSYSLEFLRALGIDKAHLTADPALNISAPPAEEAWLRRCGIEPQKNYAMLALRPWKGFDAHISVLAAAADRMYDAHGCTVVLYALEPEQDEPALRAVARKMHAPHLILRSDGYDLRELSLIGRMKAVVSMRLHALIFAAGQGVPIVGIAYDPKVSAFVKEYGRGESVALDALDAQTLCEMLDRAMCSEADNEALLRLRSLSLENIRIAEELLN